MNRMGALTDNPYTVRYMRQKLLDEFPEEIEITSKGGKEDIVTFKESASKILRQFSESPKSDETSNIRKIISTAAALLKSDVMKIRKDKSCYPDPQNLKSVDAMLSYLPETMVLFLQQMSCGNKKPLKIAAIGQCIVQLTRPIHSPLQLGLGAQMHHQYGARNVIDSLYNLGYSCSYSEVMNYEKCAAAQDSELSYT